MELGWVFLHRKIKDWEWYDDANTFRVFIHLLLSVNHQEGKWRGNVIERGSCITSYGKIAQELKLSVRNVRTSINKLKTTGELTYRGTKKYSYITINNFNMYNPIDKHIDTQPTHNRHTTDTQLTTNNNDNNDNNENKREVSSKLKEKNTNHALKVLGWFNQAMGTNFKSIHGFESNLEFWSKVYSDEDIQKALLVIRAGKWWAKDPSPTLLFRRKTPKGEPVDYIGELLNLKGGDISVE